MLVDGTIFDVGQQALAAWGAGLAIGISEDQTRIDGEAFATDQLSKPRFRRTFSRPSPRSR